MDSDSLGPTTPFAEVIDRLGVDGVFRGSDADPNDVHAALVPAEGEEAEWTVPDGRTVVSRAEGLPGGGVMVRYDVRPLEA
ncbi:MAG: hypothetical protein FJX65_02015 [Alphaproteobacteria bacterium]|nr:hypothetical protein [Alphaproteobacteria bacterium]